MSVFKYRIAKHWVPNESRKDYGWDILVTIAKEEEVREDFFVQLKGSDKPSYIDGGRIVSVSLKLTTVNWLLDKPMPSMLCVCDTGKKSEPIYYVWFQEEIYRITKEKPNWKTQKSIVFHIPFSQILAESAHKDIEEYVTRFHTDLKINASIGDILGTSFGFEKSRPLSPFTDRASRIVSEKISPVMKEAGILEITEEKDEIVFEPLSTEDQKRFKEIKKSSLALDELRDNDAQKTLDKLAAEIENASKDIKARFYNNKGVLALHDMDYKTSLEYFQKAENLRPKEPKYVSNSLLAEFLLIASDNDGREIKFGDRWEERLDNLLSENKDFSNAIRLKATWLGTTKGAKVAEDYLKGKKIWKEEPLVTRCELAEIYKDEGNWDKAIELLSEIEETGEGLNGLYWSLYGSVFLQKAFRNKSRRYSFIVYGPGPSQLDLRSLRKAEQCYVKSCKNLLRRFFL